MSNKDKKITLLPVVISILIIICVVASVLVEVVKFGKYLTYYYDSIIFNNFIEIKYIPKIKSFSDNEILSIFTFACALFAIITSFTNIILSLTKQNKMVYSIILNLLTILGIAFVILHYEDANFSTSFASDKVVYPTIISSIAVVLSIANIVCNIIFRKTLFICENKKSQIALFLTLVSIGLLFAPIITVFISGIIPFTKKTTIIYESDKYFPKRETYEIMSAFDSILCVVLMILFATITLAFFVWSTYKNKNDLMVVNLIITGVMGLCANMAQFFESGGLSWLFGIGTFMIIGSIIAFGAFKVLEKARSINSKVKKA